jgi:hypothetical protein
MRVELARQTAQAAAHHIDLEEGREEVRLGSTVAAALVLDSTVEVAGVGSTVEAAALDYKARVEDHHTVHPEEDKVTLRSLVAEVAAIAVDSLDSSAVVVDCSLVAEVDSHFGADKASLI